MDAERARAFLLHLPHVVETAQWGNNLVFWTGDKAIGGKMFTLLNLDGDGRAVVSFAAGPERFHDLLETEGLLPAPYFARIHWIAAERWDILRQSEWEEHLRHAYSLTLAKLPPRTRAVLDLPAREQKRLIADRRKLLATQAPAVKPAAQTAPKPRARRKPPA